MLFLIDLTEFLRQRVSILRLGLRHLDLGQIASPEHDPDPVHEVVDV